MAHRKTIAFNKNNVRRAERLHGKINHNDVRHAAAMVKEVNDADLAVARARILNGKMPDNPHAVIETVAEFEALIAKYFPDGPNTLHPVFERGRYEEELKRIKALEYAAADALL